MKHLKDSYWKKEQEQIVIDFIKAYQNNRESMEHNAYVQRILEQHWSKITGFLTKAEMVDQARIGVYHIIDWMQDHHHVFSLDEIKQAAAEQDITISDNQDTRERVLNNLLDVLRQEQYLKYNENKYELMWGQARPSRIKRAIERISGIVPIRIRKSPSVPADAPVAALPAPTQPQALSDPVESQSKANGHDSQESIPEPDKPGFEPTAKPKPLQVALLCDFQIENDELNALLTQIAFEFMEAGHYLILTGRPGEVLVRQKLATYWPLYVAEYKPDKKHVMVFATLGNDKMNIHKCEDVIPIDNLAIQLEQLLDKADVIILVQRDELADSIFSPKNVEARAEKQNVPIIPVGAISNGATANMWMEINNRLDTYYQNSVDWRLFAEIGPTQAYIPDIARAAVKLAEQISPRSMS